MNCAAYPFCAAARARRALPPGQALGRPAFVQVVVLGHGHGTGGQHDPGLLGRREDVDVGRQVIGLVQRAHAHEAHQPVAAVVAPARCGRRHSARSAGPRRSPTACSRARALRPAARRGRIRSLRSARTPSRFRAGTSGSGSNARTAGCSSGGSERRGSRNRLGVGTGLPWQCSASAGPSAASTTICTRCGPCIVEAQPVGEAHALGDRLGVAEPDRVAQRRRPWRTLSFRCFSPTRRCDTTSTSSQKSGASKPWPQTCASSVRTVVGVEALGARAGRRCAACATARPASSHSRATRCERRVEGARSRLARDACSRPPSHGRRSASARRDGAWRRGRARRADESRRSSGPSP